MLRTAAIILQTQGRRGRERITSANQPATKQNAAPKTTNRSRSGCLIGLQTLEEHSNTPLTYGAMHSKHSNGR